MCILGSEMKFFNGKTWKSISEYSEGDKVLQYNNDGTAEMVEPTYFCKTGSNESLHKLGIDCQDLVVLYAGMDTLLPTTQGERIKVGNLIMGLHGNQVNNAYRGIEFISHYMYDGEVNLSDSVIADIVYCLHNGTNDINGYVECRDNSVSLTNKVFELSLESKKMLLRTLGLRENGKSVYNVFGYDFELVNKLVVLWNSTYPYYITLEEDEGYGYEMLFTDSDLYGFGYIDTSKRLPRSSGYHLDVPSGMVIVKADCGIPVVVCC